MTTIELIHFDGCPKVERTRENLRAALESLGLSPEWQELVAGSPDLPAHARGWGSPTVLVDRRDVAGAGAPEGEDACRFYPAPVGDHGAPTVATIVTALRKAGA